jgi:hypothetical protein
MAFPDRFRRRFPLDKTNRRTIRTPITHTAASTFRGESGDSLPTDTHA